MPYPAPSDAEHINITAVNIDALTEVWPTITMPADIGRSEHGSLRCKFDTEQVVMLCHFTSLPNCSPEISPL